MVDPLASLGGVTGLPPRRGAPMGAPSAATPGGRAGVKDALDGLQFEGLGLEGGRGAGR
jgi:hypothetical protein